jgi:LmbE family N-acetylglucosaminyl deacetylase
MKVLVIAAHPDDEVIGAGGTIARHVALGDEVHLSVVTEGYTPDWPAETLEEKRKEVFRAAEVLGIRRISFCGFPTVQLNTVPYKELCEKVGECVQQSQPQIVYTTPRGDINRDHHIVYEATLVATRPVPGSSVRRLLSYEGPPTTRFGAPFVENLFIPNVYIDISTTLEKKIEAMSQYRTELKEFPHPRSLKALRLYAEERGISVGLKAAEIFQLVREIIA